MFSLMFMSLIIIMMCMIMLTLSLFISKKMKFDREKNSSFECGFEPLSSARIPFSLHFFIISILFLIFDIEITILLPFFISMNMTNMKNFMMMFFIFMIILILSIFHEWNQNMLNWKI
uniref:NADH dehydrogenase subunit 3 n=1 Tax=Eoneureclipsis hainanensis TaxID=3043990 RepID=UPI002551D2B2|nr:NADH dehydrogenase subunit 3 [Eoneureclipsis hainanensis]WGT74388.1 NADH dehydrogenase subunit 3 [Eoneureclipsis hainanensis]